MDVLERWKNPDTWRRPGHIALANVLSVHPDDVTHRALLDAGAKLVPVPLRDSQGAVSPEVADADVVISGGARLERDFFAALRTPRLVLRPYVGYDDIDVDSASEFGILVANVPDAFIEEVANHASALILATNRALLQTDRFVRDGTWASTRRRPENVVIRRPSVLTLGLIGFGNIARLVLERMRPFGFRVVAHDPFISAEVAQAHGITLVTLDDLLRQSDVVSIHVFLSKQTRHLLNAENLRYMKPTAWLINTSRGPVIDEAALIDSLQHGRLAGAGLDVFEEEPLAVTSPLLTLENVILTPHIASMSEEGGLQHRKRTAEIALQVALGGLPQRHAVINKHLFDEIAALPHLAGVPRA